MSDERAGNEGDYQRPRRPDANTITYLRSLPLDEKASADEIYRYVQFQQKNKTKESEEVEQYNHEGEEEEDVDYPTILSASLTAINEIYAKEVASLAGDELGSERIEMLARIACSYSPLSGRKLLYGLSGYHLHLATHRYGSHVLQTILELAVSPPPSMGKDENEVKEIKKILELDNEEELDEEAQNLPSLKELLLSVAQELLPYSNQLAVHVCGSHVMRTLLCVLAGVELIHHQSSSVSFGGEGGENSAQGVGPAIRRGKFKPKKKKKKKKPPVDDGSSTGNNAGVWKMDYVQQSNIDFKDDDLQEMLTSLSEALSTLGNNSNGDAVQPPGELQKLACHPSAGPLLTVLLRVLTYSAVSVKTKITAGGKEGNEETNRCDRRLGITQTEPYFTINSDAEKLAKHLLCWDSSVENSIDQPYARDIIYGLSGEPRGSHLLETLFRTCHDDMYESLYKCGGFDNGEAMTEYVQHDVSNFVVQALLASVRNKDQANVLINSLEHVICSGYVMGRKNRRCGVLWRVAEMCAKYNAGQEILLKHIRMGYAALLQTEGEEGEGDENKKQRHKKKNMVDIDECIPKLLHIRPPQKDGDRIQLDVAGARAVYQLLHFAPSLCGDVLTGITEKLGSDNLEWIANDGIGSRCILDAILDNPKSKEAPFSNAIQQLFRKLNGRLVSLSVERVGHHTVKKLFRSLQSLDDKAELSDELASGMNRLSGNAMGRSVMDACFVREYCEGEKAWTDAVNKQAREEEWLKDIVGKGEGVESSNDNLGNKKRKRKRKKTQSEPEKKSGDNNDGDSDNDAIDDGNGDEDKKSSAVESIMDAISIPDDTKGKEEKKRKRKRKRKADE
uniref:Nucleolar protein 9 n=1 Tax=Ditylum brightwellii TaxID=49249 RepID=A0A7S1YX12_9STRA|mmetsp:Transcript_19611/g.29250  ORF Transcript_19611/g.29250 Transcript_19611/m.29250 type:complete len:846 (+) Transcript_19611:180-2717(+)